MPRCPQHPGVRPGNQPEGRGLCPLCLVEAWDAAQGDTPSGCWDACDAEIDTHAYRKGHTMKVQFSDINEFFGELERDATSSALERGVLRVTKNYTQTRTPMLYVLEVIAGAIVHGRLVECSVPLGTVMPAAPRETPERLEQRAFALVAEITQRAQALGLEVRAGRFMP